jgi:hypothetical protein
VLIAREVEVGLRRGCPAAEKGSEDQGSGERLHGSDHVHVYVYVYLYVQDVAAG